MYIAMLYVNRYLHTKSGKGELKRKWHLRYHYGKIFTYTYEEEEDPTIFVL